MAELKRVKLVLIAQAFHRFPPIPTCSCPLVQLLHVLSDGAQGGRLEGGRKEGEGRVNGRGESKGEGTHYGDWQSHVLLKKRFRVTDTVKC